MHVGYSFDISVYLEIGLTGTDFDLGPNYRPEILGLSTGKLAELLK